MKKVVLNYLVIAAFAVLAAFTSCNKDGDENVGSVIDKITANVEGGAKYNGVITKVKLGTGNRDEKEEVLATGNWSNGGFTIELPKTVDAKYLEPMFDEDNIPPTVTISNKDAKFCETWIIGYDKDDKYVDGFIYGNKNKEVNTHYWAEYIYADSDINISGTYEDRVLSISLKKGWNVTYTTMSCKREDEITRCTMERFLSTTVSGMKWYCDDGFWGWD